MMVAMRTAWLARLFMIAAAGVAGCSSDPESAAPADAASTTDAGARNDAGNVPDPIDDAGAQDAAPDAGPK